jgi:hypothetical protein
VQTVRKLWLRKGEVISSKDPQLKYLVPRSVEINCRESMLLSSDRQSNNERGTAVLILPDFESAAMCRDDTVTHGQTESRPLAGRLGCKEGIE